MPKINTSYDSSNSSMSSGGSESLAPLSKTMENIESGTITVNELMIPFDHGDAESEDDTELIVPSSASPCDRKVTSFQAFKALQMNLNTSPNSEISDQDVKIREYMNRTEVCEDAVLEDTVFEPTNCDKNSRFLAADLSFQGKISEISFSGEKSPDDLFEDSEENEPELVKDSVSVTDSSITSTLNDSKLLKKIQRSLSGLVPPSSVTSQCMSITQLLDKYYENLGKENLMEMIEQSSESSVFKSDLSMEETSRTPWPESYRLSGFGIHHNRSCASETIEQLSLDLIQRYISSETASSCSVTNKLPQSTRKRSLKSFRVSIQSPERRLSHLARRRATFSSANLKASTSTNRQLVLNPKRNDQKRLIIGKSLVTKTRTPKRGKTPKRKTPRSSKKKREVLVVKPTLTRENSKRALFQSPAVTTEPIRPVISEDVAKRVEKSKRVLFSPPNKLDRSTSFSENPIDRYAFAAIRHRSMNHLDEIGQKRKRTEDKSIANVSKLRKISEDLQPSSSLLLQKSQSFYMPNSQSNARNESFFRTKTDIIESGYQKVLSEHHKKKLLWAVATALKNKNLTTVHPEYKKHAANLFRVVKTIYLQLEDPTLTNISSTSERMMRIANSHVFDVIRGTSFETIIHKERERIENIKNTKKIDGYIGINEYHGHKITRQSSFFSAESSIDGFSQCSSQTINDWILQNKDENSAEQRPLTGSSKKNDDGMALKENLDKQRSTQKNTVSGKDQKLLGFPRKECGATSNLLKAKRQISFDH